MGKPEIRFKGYTDEWEQRKVVEVAPLQRGFDLPSASMKPGKYPVVMSNGIGGYHFEYKVKGPGVVTGRSGTIGKLHYIEDDYWPHNTTLWVTDFNGNNQKFIYYLYQGLDLNRFGTGSGVPTLNRNDVHDAIVSVPSKNEQERISAYLTILDQLITLHQRKCDEVKSLKKYMLQKMFPQNEQKVPEIRFEGFTEAWEQRKLGELVGIYDGVHQTPDYQDSGIMFLSVENITTLKSEKYISEEAFERDYKVYPEKGDILMTRIGDVGTTNVVETAEKVAFYVSLALLKPNGIDSYFLSNAMKTNAFQKGLRERTLVTAIPQKINKDEIGKIDIVITNNDEEQKKIGAYFSNLDHLITLHQQKCEELKKIKKFMLQKMFV